MRREGSPPGLTGEKRRRITEVPPPCRPRRARLCLADDPGLPPRADPRRARRRLLRPGPPGGLPADRAALPQPALGRARRPRRARRRRVGAPLRPVRAAARQSAPRRSRCATTATSSARTTPTLGDGRGFLFAQLRDAADGRLLDLGTKGSGPTPWSRDGDGRLTLKGGVREVLATEMLEALGVYTSKTFSACSRPARRSSAATSRRRRGRRCWSGCSHSHVRFGSFQRLAVARRAGRCTALLDYCGRAVSPAAAAPRPTWPPGSCERCAGRSSRRLAGSPSGWWRASSTACSTPTT